MKKLFLPVIIFTLSVASLCGQSIATKNVFKGEYPLTSTFRGNNNTVATYADFLNEFTKSGTHIPDLIDINLFYDTTNAGFANQMALAYPDNLFLQVKQANSGISRYMSTWYSSVDRICALPITFPGHWVVKPPTTLTANISASDTIINVASASGFAIGNYMPAFPNGCPAMLVKTDSLGNKIWIHYEYIYITSISGTTFTITRAYRDSPAARAFVSGRAIVAPVLVMSPWNEPPVWYINFSPACPLDSNGKTASQIMIDDLNTQFGAGGTLSNFSGVDYASGPFTDAPLNVDYNWDGAIDTSSDYYSGVNSFLFSIRQQVDSNFILITGNNNLQYINNFNGLNNEGLVQPDDPWRSISNTLNENAYWSAYAPSPHLGLEVLRIQDDSVAGIANLSKWVQLTRLGYGYATCLGVCADVRDKIISLALTDSSVVALTWVELYKGTENVEHWLGHAVSTPIHVASSTPTILGDSATDWTHIMQKLFFQNGTMSVVGNELILAPDFHLNHNLTMSLYLSQTKNLTVLFDVISNGSQTLHTIKSPTLSISYQTGADATTHYTNFDYLRREYYWRGLDSTATSCTVSFNFTGNDTIRFRSMSVHEVADCIARSFEHGVVLVNPGLEDTTFNLTTLFGTGISYTRLTAPTLSVPPQWQSQYQQTIEMNDGSAITNPAQVVVPALNALFLKSQPTTTGLNEQPQSNEVAIFPNPNSGKFTITSNNKLKEIALYNVLGEIFFTQQIISDNIKQEIDVSYFSKGIYFVKVTDMNSTVVNKKIIVQ